jgi:hypothetical protein
VADDLALSAKNIHNYWRKVEVRGPDECWPWVGEWQTVDGYGRMGVDGKNIRATHIALVLSGRPKPDHPRDCALHGDCSDPRCVNPRHLRWGTRQENMGDKVRLGRQFRPKGELHKGAKLNDDAVREIRRSPMKQQDLADKFGVSRVVINGIKRGRMWAHVPD